VILGHLQEFTSQPAGNVQQRRTAYLWSGARPATT
jgi:hypothetical protein